MEQSFNKRLNWQYQINLDMDYIVDVQGFKGPGSTFVAKELTIFALNEGAQPVTYLFKPPYSWNYLPAKYKSVNNWITRNHHGLTWDSGDIPYDQLEEILKTGLKYASSVYVKGSEKKCWLENTTSLGCIIDMDILNCPSLKKLREDYKSDHCHHHINYENCSIGNVKLMKMWLITKPKTAPSLQRSLNIFFEVKRLALMSTEDIACLPVDFISIFAASKVEEAWDKLPVTMQMDPDILECRRCQIHYQTTNSGDCIDGPAPMIKDCAQCQKFY